MSTHDELVQSVIKMAEELGYTTMTYKSGISGELCGRFWKGAEIYGVFPDTLTNGIRIFFQYKPNASCGASCSCDPYKMPEKTDDSLLFDVPDAATLAAYLENGRSFAKAMGAKLYNEQEAAEYVKKQFGA